MASQLDANEKHGAENQENATAADRSAQWLPALKYIDVRFFCRLTTDALFSAYKGSMLRGSLGANLRKGLCMTRQKDCQTCMLAPRCVFPRIFNPAPVSGDRLPPPFCLEPDMEPRRQYNAGELFGFDLKLFSYGVDYLPFFVHAFHMAGENGLGNFGQPGKFVIEKITSQGVSIYDHDNLAIPQCRRITEPEQGEPPGCNDVAIELCTPLRHKSGNHFTANLEFTDIFHLTLRRVKALCLLDGVRWLLAPEQYVTLREAAQAIRTSQSSVRWHDWTRYSARQESFMKFGGLMGKITCHGDLSMFKEMLRFARAAHIGKQTSFGLGRIEFAYKPGAIPPDVHHFCIATIRSHA